MPRTHRSDSKTRPKPKYLWTTALASRVAISTGADDSIIAQPVDWERASSSFERATLVAVRGWFSIAPQSATGVATWFTYIGLYDEDELSSIADAVATYDSEDILFTSGGHQHGAIEPLRPYTEQLNVRVKRRITSAQQLRMVRSSDAGSIFSFSCVARACIRYS